MDVRELRELLLKRLYIELQLFKDSMLRREKEEILKASYETEIYLNLYEIFAVHIDNLQEDAVRRLLGLKFGILESVYREWLTREDCFFEELRAYACGELETVSELGSLDYGKEDGDGTEHDKAA